MLESCKVFEASSAPPSIYTVTDLAMFTHAEWTGANSEDLAVVYVSHAIRHEDGRRRAKDPMSGHTICIDSGCAMICTVLLLEEDVDLP